MAFCGNCGAQSEGGEHFCKKCGHEFSAAPAPAPVAPAPPPAPFVAAAPVAYPPQPVAPYPQPYAVPPPYAVAAPPARKKMSPAFRLISLVVGVIALYSGLHSLGVITWPTKMVGLLQPPAGVANAALVQQQALKSAWHVTNGDAHLSKPQWTNNSNQAILSLDVECDQYDQSGTDQAQKHLSLSSSNQTALAAGQTEVFSDLDIGQSVQSLSKVNCGPIGVTLPPGAPGTVGILQPPAGVANANLVQQQTFTSPWQVTNGDLHLSTPKWTNNSNTPIQSVDLECDQYDQSGTDQAQKHLTLTTSNQAPLSPSVTEDFNDIDIGQAVQNVTKVNCGVMGVTLPSQ